MLLAEPIKHTDAIQLARFNAMTADEQIREIWLNTRETNGHVAEAMRDIAHLEELREKDRTELTRWREGVIEPWMAAVDKRLIAAASVIAFILTMAPVLFFVLGKYA